MKRKNILLLLFVSFFLFLEGKVAAQNTNTSSSILRHIVMISFKKDIPSDSVRALDDIYANLSKGPMVKDFESGVNISTRDTGIIKHVYVTTFTSKEDLDSYKKMPMYPKLFKISLAIASEVTVADYWVKK
ncbi:MAG TPA: Dabb family protein [Puia sp.]|nr:Dabb family protein [Puia sp.]